MTTSSKRFTQLATKQKIATTTSQGLLNLLKERDVPKERGAVLEMIANNFDLIANSSDKSVVGDIIKRSPDAAAKIEAMGLKRMSKLWHKGTGKDLKDMAFSLIQGKVFDLKR